MNLEQRSVDPHPTGNKAMFSPGSGTGPRAAAPGPSGSQPTKRNLRVRLARVLSRWADRLDPGEPMTPEAQAMWRAAWESPELEAQFYPEKPA